MKAIKIISLASLLASGVMANESLMVNMAQMENGLSNIQKGFLYNAPALIKSGVTEIKKANALFHSIDASKKYLPKDKQHMGNIAFNAAKKIDSSSEELLKALDNKEYNKASRSYSDIVSSCTACHAVVRGW